MVLKNIEIKTFQMKHRRKKDNKKPTVTTTKRMELQKHE